MSDPLQPMLIDVDQFPCGCLVTSPDREILFANQYFSQMLDWQPEELTGQNMNVLLNRAAQLFCESYVIPTIFREGQCYEFALPLTLRDGSSYPKVASVRKTPDGNLAWVFLEAEKRNKLFYELETARFALQAQREQLEEMTRTDELTGLANRRDLESSARGVLQNANRSGLTVSVLMMDIDRFKSINDTFGHDVGDRALCALANALKWTCRKSDIVARLGGDEFVCVLNNTDARDAGALCDRIHETVARTMPDTCPFTVSIGLAVKPRDAQIGFPDILKLADQALYTVKGNGRNTTHIVTASAA